MNDTDNYDDVRLLVMEAVQESAESSKNTCDDDAWVEGFSGDMAEAIVKSLVENGFL